MSTISNIILAIGLLASVLTIINFFFPSEAAEFKRSIKRLLPHTKYHVHVEFDMDNDEQRPK